MNKTLTHRERLSIDVLPNEHRQIKTCAALHGQTIREFVLAGIRERLRQEIEDQDLSLMTTYPDKVLQELWDNEKDAAYDRL